MNLQDQMDRALDEGYEPEESDEGPKLVWLCPECRERTAHCFPHEDYEDMEEMECARCEEVKICTAYTVTP